MKPIGDLAWDGILAKNPSDGSLTNHAGNNELRIENNTRWINFLYRRGGDNDSLPLLSPNTIVTGGEWSHIAVTDVKGGDLHYDINGELVDTWTSPLEETVGATNTNPLYIGSRVDLFTGMN